MLPPVSVPSAKNAWPAATAAEEPPDEPPGTVVSSHGLRTGPYALFSFDEPIANSSQLVLPIRMAPAAVSRSSALDGVRGEVALQDSRAGRGRQPAVRSAGIVERAGDENVLQRVGDAQQRPIRPFAGSSASSAASATASARSRPTARNVFSRSASRSMRARHASTSSRELTSRDRSRAAASLIVRSARGRVVGSIAQRPSWRIVGTRSIAPSRNGALASAASRPIGGRASSSRITFSQRDHLGGGADAAGVDRLQLPDRLQDAVELSLHEVDLLIRQAKARQGSDVLHVLATDHEPMLAGDNAPMAAQPGTTSIAIRDGRIEAFRLPTSPNATGVPLLVLGGVETGLRPLAGTEHILMGRWSGRAKHRPVVVIGRPLPDDAGDAERLMHPRLSADAAAEAVRWLADNGGPQPPYAIEAESGGGRISLWLTVDHPELVTRLVLASVASETPADSPMAERMGRWIEMARAGDWGMFFSHMASVMKPASGGGAPSFDAAARLQPRPATPERFIGELLATLDPSSFVTDRLGEISVPTLVIAGALDQVVPPEATRLVAERINDARLEVDPDCGHTVRATFTDYHNLVEAFLAEGDSP